MNNVYYRNYINSISPLLVPTLSIGFGAASAAVAVKFYRSIQKIHALNDEADHQGRKRTPSRRPRRAVAGPGVPPSTPAQSTIAMTEVKPTRADQRPVQSPPGPVVTAEKKETSSDPEKPRPKPS